jgi:TP901 family phage tail tape measure protein
MAGGIDISVILSLLGGQALTDAFDSAAASAEGLADKAEKIQAIGAVGFAALSGAIGVSVSRFAEFEGGFASVIGLLDEGSFSTVEFADGIKSMEDGILALRAGGDSFDDLNLGLFNLISGGIAAEDSIDVLTTATQLADAGATDAGTAVNALVASMSAFKSANLDAEVVAQSFFTAQKYGITTVGQLAGEFNKVGGAANGLGISFEETLGALTAMTANGMKPTAVAATELAALMKGVVGTQKNIKKQSKEVQEAWSLESVAANGLVESARALNEAFKGDKVKIAAFLGDSSAINAFNSLTGGQADLFDMIMGKLGDAQGMQEAYAASLEAVGATINEQMEGLTGSFDAFLALMGRAFAPTVKEIIGVLQQFATMLVELDPTVLNIIASVTLFAAAVFAALTVIGTVGSAIATGIALIATIGPQLAVAAAFIGAFGVPILLVVGAIALLVAGFLLFLNYGDEIGEFFADLPGMAYDGVMLIGQIFSDFFNAFPGKVQEFMEAAGFFWQSGLNFLGEAIGGFKDRSIQAFLDFVRPVTDTAKQIQDAFYNALNFVGQQVENVKRTVMNFLQDVGSALGLVEKRQANISARDDTGQDRPGFAVGGYVSGPGSSTSDSILARLSDGEFVLKSKAVRALGVDFLNALNGGTIDLEDILAGDLAGFAEGGLASKSLVAPIVPSDGLYAPGSGGPTNRLEIIAPDGSRHEAAQTDEQARATRAVAARSKRRRPHGNPTWV